MKTDLYNYDIFPKVFEQNKPVNVTVKPLGRHCAFSSDKSYTISVCPLGEGNPHTYPDRDNKAAYSVKPDDDGCLRFTHAFIGEQEHFIRIYDGDRRIAQLSVYSLAPDLTCRYPYYGDLHVHTWRSDGREAPEITAANYRRDGYDFTVISDHGRYYASLEAIAAYKDVELGLNIVPGEEVHLPGNDVHIVNFGGKWSINGLHDGSAQYADRGADREWRSVDGNCPEVITVDKYKAEVNALADTLDITEGIERFTYAACVWAFNHIREAGGLGIYAHPYWISDVFQVPESFNDYMLKTAPFDAFEILGGESYFEQNGFQMHKYYDLRRQGYDFPVVGSSDSHGTVNNGAVHVASTIVFAPENTREALISAIKDKYSVAVDDLVKDIGFAGDFRFVRYGAFLQRNYFPLLREICYEEGRMMKDYVNGYASAEELSALKGRADRLRSKVFAF